MGEAMIIRRGGFDIAELGEMQAYHMCQTDNDFSIPEDIDMNKIKAYICYRGYTPSAYMAIYTNDGVPVVNNSSSSNDGFKKEENLTINMNTRIVRLPTTTSASSKIGLTILY